MIRRWQLESGRVSDIIKSKKLYEDLVEFHWRYYSELAFQRRSIREELNSSLRNAAAAFQFPRWQRVVKYKYSLDPLSAKASLFDPGGRFNVGAIDPTRYPMFPPDLFQVAKHLKENRDPEFARKCRAEILNTHGKAVVFPPIPA